MLDRRKSKSWFRLPRPSALLSGGSLAIGIGLTFLLIWTWWDASRWSISIRDARYSFVVRHGDVTLVGPPPAAPGSPAASAMVARMSNEDIVWKLYPTAGDTVDYLTARADAKAGGTAEICTQFRAVPDGAIRPLLHALDDPHKVFAAHFALIKICNTARTSVAGEFQRGSKMRTLTHLEGFPVLLSSYGMPQIDLTDWRVTRDYWHKRLDVQISSINFEWLLLATIAFPLLRLVQQLLRRRAESRGLCPNCRYNLTGNVSGTCPECGQTVANSAGANKA